MYIVKHNEDLQKIVNVWKKYNTTVGFVPTMGALHEGHLGLVRESLKSNDITIVSIFVNPTQFNDQNDLAKYPRMEKEDMVILEVAGADILFLPDVEEIYTKDGFEVPKMELGQLINKLDGLQRPGHFEGVVQVVYRFLDLIRPDRLYMGLKDFQQQRIISSMLLQLNTPIDLVAMPTMREESGLAMSSRNKRLSDEERERAAVLYKVLKKIKTAFQNGADMDKIKKEGEAELEASGMRVEYLTLVDLESLEEVKSRQSDTILLAAVWMGQVRLIDNIIV